MIFKYQTGNKIAWHNRRYTAKQIALIQAALNKLALGYQIAVDGKLGKETLKAIEDFLRLHSNLLKVDGLVGDKTLTALGLSGIGDSSLPATRKGYNQAKGSFVGDPSISATENERMRAYYTSPEMWEYLSNSTNAALATPEYYNHYRNALNYVSPEQASILKHLNNEGDAYDEDTAKQYNAAFRREQGIRGINDYAAKVAGPSKNFVDENLARYLKTYGLTDAEMQEATADPNFLYALLNGTIRRENERGKKREKEQDVITSVLNAMSDAGVGIIKTMLNPASAAYAAKTWNGKGSFLNHYAHNKTELSDALLLNPNNKVTNFFVDVAGNPWSWPSIATLGINGGRGLYNIGQNAKNGVYGSGNVGMGTDGIVGSRVPYNRSATVGPITSTSEGLIIRTADGLFANVGASSVNSPTLYVNGQSPLLDLALNFQVGQVRAGYFKPNEWRWNNLPYNKKTHVENAFEKLPYAEVPLKGVGVATGSAMMPTNSTTYTFRPVTLAPLPNYSADYAPYVGWNRISSQKHGGTINRTKYYKK